MLKRCYGNKDNENFVKRVRFNCPVNNALDDDHLSVKSVRSEKRSSYQPLIVVSGVTSP